MRKGKAAFFCIGIVSLFLGLFACDSPSFEEKEVSTDHFVLEPGFRLEVVASEPLIEAPVVMNFDPKGRLWVVEMRGYMPNLEGIGEEAPNGRIVLLEDKDKDGVMDHSQVFLDSLVLPRALLVGEKGLLYAEPPNLWWIEIRQGDKPGKRLLVDSTYTSGGNVEHQPNGLLYGRDNWIYNAKSTARYRLHQGKWEKQTVAFRGQWGITQDDFGHLFYNDNSNQLMGDWVAPGLLVRHPGLVPQHGTFRQIVTDQRVYPLHASAVNRGYRDGILDSAGLLRNFTAACGPVIYRGDQFPADYYGNAFVAEPSANLIKRNLLEREGAGIRGMQAYEGQEFLATKEEGFRPVSLYNGPDGTLWGVDMHRGIIQHGTYLTDYLRAQLIQKGLDTLFGYGRIFRIVHEAKAPRAPVRLSRLSSKELVPYLNDPNGWNRDMAQQLLVSRRGNGVVGDIRSLLAQGCSPEGSITAWWTLQGLEALAPYDLAEAVHSDVEVLRATVARLAGELAQGAASSEALGLLQQIKDDPSSWVQLNRALSLGSFHGDQEAKARAMLVELAHRFPEDELFHEAIISGLHGKEKAFLGEDIPLALGQLLLFALEKSQAVELPWLTRANRDARIIMGQSLYVTHCGTCHHKEGGGLPSLGPPLVGSEYVAGPAEQLVLIVLHGLTGPVTVKGKTYQPPEVAPEMPGLKDNREISDGDISAILTFIRVAWGNNGYVSPEEVAAIREKYARRDASFTEEELKNIFGGTNP